MLSVLQSVFIVLGAILLSSGFVICVAADMAGYEADGPVRVRARAFVFALANIRATSAIICGTRSGMCGAQSI
jgi:hypothetical protein